MIPVESLFGIEARSIHLHTQSPVTGIPCGRVGESGSARRKSGRSEAAVVFVFVFVIFSFVARVAQGIVAAIGDLLDRVVVRVVRA